MIQLCHQQLTNLLLLERNPIRKKGYQQQLIISLRLKYIIKIRMCTIIKISFQTSHDKPIGQY